MIKLQMVNRNTDSVKQIYTGLSMACNQIQTQCENIKRKKYPFLDGEYFVNIFPIGYDAWCDECPAKQGCRDLCRATAYAWNVYCDRIREK